jgi:two-component system response regulator HupR/HoxA
VNQKILFVDDEPAALNCYRKMLESEFNIATVASGEEGLVSLRDHGPFAVVISSMQMAGIGWSAIPEACAPSRPKHN